VLSYASGRGARACVSSAGVPGLSCGASGEGAIIGASLAAGAGLHVLTVDGREGAFGSYTVNVALGELCP
jgi:hypothetical protein